MLEMSIRRTRRIKKTKYDYVIIRRILNRYVRKTKRSSFKTMVQRRTGEMLKRVKNVVVKKVRRGVRRIVDQVKGLVQKLRKLLRR